MGTRPVHRAMMRGALVVGTAVALAGCAPAAATLAPSSDVPAPAVSAVPAASPSVPPAGSASVPLAGSRSAPPAASPTGASVSFQWPDGGTPAVSRAMTGLDESFINPGAVIKHGEMLHMFANLFTAWPGRVQVVHLVSDNGVQWDVVPGEPPFSSDDVPFAKPGADVSTGFVRDDGTWVLVFETVNAAAPWEIGVATAPGPDGPWTITPEPVLTAGPAGAWDEGGLAWPSVVPTEDGYAMYYSASTSNRSERAIGRATSTDGTTWTKDEEPVLVAEAEWEGVGLDRPRVVAVPDGYLMVYAGTDLNDRGIARSSDGVTWTRDGDTPALTIEDLPVDGRAWDAALVERDGALTYYLEIGAGTQALGTEVYRATAELP